MDLHKIEIFCTLIKLRSFSKTADALYLTQPTVSGHIKNLEAELGVRLLDRLGKKVIPTQEGDILFRYGQKLIELRDRAKQEVEGLSGKVGGLLKIGGSTIPGAYVLPAYIGAFKEKYPASAIYLTIDDTAKITRSVQIGELSIGVVGARISNPQLDSHTFLKDELLVTVPPRHPWARKGSIPADALKGESFILREQGSGTRHLMEEKLARVGIIPATLNVVAVMGSSDAVRQAVKAGLGISILSIRAIQEDIQAGRLAGLSLKGLKLERSFSVILLKGKSRPPLCKAFLDFLLSERNA